MVVIRLAGRDCDGGDRALIHCHGFPLVPLLIVLPSSAAPTLPVVVDTKELVHSLILFNENEITCYSRPLRGCCLRPVGTRNAREGSSE